MKRVIEIPDSFGPYFIATNSFGAVFDRVLAELKHATDNGDGIGYVCGKDDLIIIKTVQGALISSELLEEQKKDNRLCVPEKVRPLAEEKYSSGNDGRDGHYYIQYSCPHCHKVIREDDIACTNCATFFDWSKKAHTQVKRSLEWT